MNSDTNLRDLSTTGGWVRNARVAIILIVIGSLFLRSKFDLFHYDTSTLLKVSFLYLLTSIFFALFNKKIRTTNQEKLATYFELTVDIIFITLIVYSTGGVQSRLAFLYIVPVLSGSLLSPFASIIIGLSTLVAYFGLIYAEYTNFITSVFTDTVADEYFSKIQMIRQSLIVIITTFIGAYYFNSIKKLNTQIVNIKEESTAKSKAILESIGDGIIVTDRQGIIVEINDKALHLLNLDFEDCVGKPHHAVWNVTTQKGEPTLLLDRPIEKVLTTGVRFFNTTATTDTYYERKNMGTFPVLTTVTPVILHDTTAGVVESFRDITTDKKVDEAKTEFISIASHQLKTPPTAIKLLTERLLGSKMGELNEKQKEYISDIHTSNQRMIELVNALLNVSRIELGGFSIQAKNLDSLSLLKNVILELTPLAEKKGIHIITSFEVQNLTLPLDETLFRVLVTNLITNAIRYSHESSELVISYAKNTQGETIGDKKLTQDYHIFSVTDTGLGIPDDEKDKIFTKFYRASNTKENHPDGTGLGLYIVKSILKKSGGDLWFISKKDVGSTFYIGLPISGMKSVDTGKIISPPLE